jgi:hypothetical protein
MKKILLSVFLLSFVFASLIFLYDVDAQDKCTMDIQCGVGKKCVDGVCVGGIVPEIKGNCVQGKFGKKVCDNTGKECSNDSECFK